MENQTNQEKRGSSIGKYIRYGIYAVIAIFVIRGIFGNGGSNTEYVEETITTPTEGVITSVEEVQEEIYKITDEEIVPQPEDSRIIATHLSGEIDTFTLDEVSLVDTTYSDKSNRRSYTSRIIRSVVIGGVIGYMMGRPMGSSLNRSSYRSDAAYNKSANTTRTRMRSTASSRTVRKSTSGKSGFGSGKSTRSYGG